mgnify:CR=1 FL=1
MGRLSFAANQAAPLNVFLPLAEVTTEDGSVSVRDVRSQAVYAAPEFWDAIGAAERGVKLWVPLAAAFRTHIAANRSTLFFVTLIFPIQFRREWLTLACR